MAREFNGIAVSSGVVMGKAVVYRHKTLPLNDARIHPSDIDTEIQSFQTARAAARQAIQTILEASRAKLGASADVFEGHIEIVEDPDMGAEIERLIREQKKNVVRAIYEVIEANAVELEALENEYLRERAADVRDIGKRMMYLAAGIEMSDLSAAQPGSILIAEDLTPSDTAQLDREKFLGFVTQLGGKTSHVAIMAQTLEIPAIVGVAGVVDAVQQGEEIILDAVSGALVVDPTADQVAKALEKQKKFVEETKELFALRELPAASKDGHTVALAANIGTVEDIKGALHHGAQGVGLYRTEFLFMDRDAFPGEEEQFEAYRKAAEAFQEEGVIIRTIDIGGDKPLSYFNIPAEENPFLGWRAIRICLDHPDIFKTQLRAVLRASALGKVRLMFPMIISVNEVQRAKAILEEAKSELRARGQAFDEHIEVGIMVETPAAVALADKLAKEVSFFSIGANDLTQYTLAVDRGNDKISHLYDGLEPAVLQMIQMVIDAGHRHQVWVGMCGAMAGLPQASVLLMGMGLDEFSMNAVSLSRVKKVIRNASYKDAQALAVKVLSLASIEDVYAALETFGK